MMRLLFLLLFGSVLLTGCAKPLYVKPQGEAQRLWQHQQSVLGASMAQWRATGRIALSTEKGGGALGFNWHQVNGQFDVLLSAALGRGDIRVRKRSKIAALDVSGRPTVYGPNAEILVAQQTGWRVPFQKLTQWVVGLPADAKEIRVDEKGRLRALVYDGWQVSYKAYQTVDGLELPRRVDLFRDQITIKLVVNQWHPGR